MNEWASKKFNYEIVDKKGNTLATIFDYLTKLEDFAIKSKLLIDSIERTGSDNFKVYVTSEKEWKI
jgi:hypothetical protein